jgi:hypothetical protein
MHVVNFDELPSTKRGVGGMYSGRLKYNVLTNFGSTTLPVPMHRFLVGPAYHKLKKVPKISSGSPSSAVIFFLFSVKCDGLSFQVFV